MTHHNALTTARCAAIFSDEITAAGGTIADSFDDGRLLIVRAILPRVAEVRPNDRLQGGVALRASTIGISVCPYVLRAMCTNGMIFPLSIRSGRIEIGGDRDTAQVEAALRVAIRTCGAPEAFADATRDIRSSLQVHVDLDLGMLRLSHLASVPESSALREAILRELSTESDRSGFALMNAITAVARETQDPELRWRLESLGSAVPVLVAPFDLPPDDHGVRVKDGSDAAAWRMLLRAAT